MHQIISQLAGMERSGMLRVALMIVIVYAAITSGANADDRRPPTPTLPPTTDTHGVEAARLGLAPLLREGSQIQNVRGTLHEHTATGTWRFTITSPEHLPIQGLRHEFIMLPSTHLSEMQQVLASMPDRAITFQLTGEVFVYSGRNYLLASFPPRIISEETLQQGDVDQSELEAEGEEPDRPRSAADIMRELERETGPVGRSTAPPRARDSERRPRADADRLLPEGASVQLRRGRIGRDAGGAWQFVFDADATGRADPPMTLMACQLLERIEQYARRAGGNSPVLLSGRVFVYGGRNYLLPTVFQIPNERTELTP